MRLVLDTTTVVLGLLWSGSPSQLIDAAIVGVVSLFSSAVLWICSHAMGSSTGGVNRSYRPAITPHQFEAAQAMITLPADEP